MIYKLRAIMRNNAIIRRTIYPVAWYFMNRVLHWRSRLLKVYGREILQKVQDVAVKENVRCSPYFGTLLGLVRDGKLIEHDTDMDFIIDPRENKIKMFYDRLKEEGFVPERMAILNDKLLEFSMSYNVVIVDFFLVGHDGDKARNFFVFNDRGEVRLHSYPEISKMVEMRSAKGDSFLVPDNASAHLDNEYGNWRVPNKRWDARRGPSFSCLLDGEKCCFRLIRTDKEIDEYFATHSVIDRINPSELPLVGKV